MHFLDLTAEEDRKKVTVDCAMEQMSVHIERTLIPGFRLGDLHLRDKNCLPTKTANSSHVTITTPLTGCGTTLEHRDDYVIYRNVVKDGYAMNAIIGRLQVCRQAWVRDYTRGIIPTYTAAPFNAFSRLGDRGQVFLGSKGL